MKPLCVDLYCGLGGWAEGFLAERYDVIGFDIEPRPYPGMLILQDVLTLHGSQFRNAACIVASPPCQKYSYMAMPWTRAKSMAESIRSTPGQVAALNKLFYACFRIQREANAANYCAPDGSCAHCGGIGHYLDSSRCDCCYGSGKAAKYIPMVVENVKGAQPWVGRARWHYGSFYLWGDVPALMPGTRVAAKVPGMNWSRSDKPGYKPVAFNGEAIRQLATKVPMNFHEHEKVGKPGRSFQSAAVEVMDGRKQEGSGAAWFDKALDERRKRNHPKAFGWRAPKINSKSSKRAQASAEIARIPFPLAQHIARVFHPGVVQLPK